MLRGLTPKPSSMAPKIYSATPGQPRLRPDAYGHKQATRLTRPRFFGSRWDGSRRGTSSKPSSAPRQPRRLTPTPNATTLPLLLPKASTLATTAQCVIARCPRTGSLP